MSQLPPASPTTPLQPLDLEPDYDALERAQYPWRRPHDIILSLLVLTILGAILYQMRPAKPRFNAAQTEMQTQSCLSNLNQISRAFALYAQDFDGKFARGTDPEDHNFPQIWAQRFRRPNYEAEARQTPLLIDLLEPYHCPRQAWHCPADVGWSVSQLPNLHASLLRDVRPSAWQQLGMSYFYLTERGFAGTRARDLEEPAQAIVLFDGDLWHRSGSKDLSVGTQRRTVNVFFGDGRAQTLDTPTFSRLINQ